MMQIMQDIVIVTVLKCFLLIANAGFVTNITSYSNFTRQKRGNLDKIRCVLPSFPEHGEWKLVVGEAKPDDKVAINTLLKYECSFGYKLSSSPYLVCDDNWESVQFPVCEALCPPLYPSSSIELKCIDRTGKSIKCHEATEGTYLSYSCAPFYETPFGYKKSLLCTDGSWNYPKPICQPVCGKTIPKDAKPLIYGGKDNERLEYPWVVAIYNKMNGSYVYNCGGSILSLTVVLTAAHCVTNGYGDALPEKTYLIGAGKLYSEYHARQDEHAQYLEISKIIVHDKYKGEQNRFLADIAVLVTKGSFILNEVIQPVCFNDVISIPLHAGSIGEVSGWGRTDGGNISEVLKTLKIPYKYETTCNDELPREWAAKYNTFDKICAGFYNMNTSVCDGDSGSGLAFKNYEDNRYYVHGVVSLAPTTRNRSCDIQQNALYTKVAFYYDFIDKQLTKYTVNVKDCVLPSFPQNGKWNIENQPMRKPGDLVPSNTILRLKCNLGYKLSAPVTNIECGVAHNMPTCQLLCPPLNFPDGTSYRCTDKDNNVINCLDAVDGTTLSYACPVGYRVPEGTLKIRSCVVGSWGHPLPSCIKETDQSFTTSSPYLPNSTTTSDVSATTSNPTSTTTPYPDLDLDAESGRSKVAVICVYEAQRYFVNNVDPDELDGSLCNYVVYNSVSINVDGSLKLQGNPKSAGDNKSLFQKVADMKTRYKKLKVVLSAEEADFRTEEFSKMANDTVKRSTFVNSAISFMELYKFDGLNLVWIPQKKDETNFGKLLVDLKEAFKPKELILTASVYVAPTYLGYPITVMKQTLDWINVQNYNGYLEDSKYTGQYSAFKPSPKESDWQMELSNLISSVRSWSSYFGPNVTALSIAFYGRYFTLKDPDEKGVHAPTIPGESGIISYSEICQKYKDWTRVWDRDQQNPYRYSGNKWFGYDDAESVNIKAAYISSENYFGVHVYSVDADDVKGKCGPKQILLKNVLRGLRSR